MGSHTAASESETYTLGPPLRQEAPKPPFRPQVAGKIAFFFGLVSGALIAAVNLRRMGDPQKAEKVMWITILSTAVVATVLIIIPTAVGRLLGLSLEIVWYFVFPKIHDEEFRQWESTHKGIKPSNGWRALGWGLFGAVLFLVIIAAMAIFLDATGIYPQ